MASAGLLVSLSSNCRAKIYWRVDQGIILEFFPSRTKLHGLWMSEVRIALLNIVKPLAVYTWCSRIFGFKNVKELQ